MIVIYSRSKIVEQAESWLGCKEANGSHKQIIDVYNTQNPLPRGYKVQYTDSWCATFVSACAVKCGYTDIIPTECSCTQMIAKLKQKGRWKEDDSYVPSPGDLLFYDWQDTGIGDDTGAPDHVGIVEKVSENVITVIEGNYQNSVKRRGMRVNGKFIRGYGVPAYTDNAVVKLTTTPTTTTRKTATQSAKLKKDSLAGSYKTTANLNMRNGAGSSWPVMVVLQKGTTVRNYGYYTEVKGIKWLYVQVICNNTVYTGFCSSAYLKKQ